MANERRAPLGTAASARFVPGLVLAFAGPPAVAAASLALSPSAAATTANVLGQLALWLLAAGLLAITRFVERLPLASIGLRPPTGSSVLAGALAAFVLLYAATPIGSWLVGSLGFADLGAGLARLRDLPRPVLVAAAVTAGAVEELLYRGYAIERLATLTGSTTLGAAIALAAFTLAHWPFWGAGAALFTLVPGAVLTALYVWKRDLGANVLAHAATAMVQLLGVATTPSG